MGRTKTLTALFLICILLLSLVACDDPAPEPTEPTIHPVEAYEAAKGQLLAAPNRILSYSASTTRMIYAQAYTETISGTASFSDVGTEQMIAVVKENLNYNTLSAEHLLSFCNGRAYSRISGSIFGADISSEDFMATQLPVALLDAALYDGIGYTVHGDGMTIFFQRPTALEKWVDAPEDARIVQVFGTANLDKDGTLIQTEYAAEYTCNDVVFSVHVTLKCTTPAQLELSALHPEHPEDYTLLSCLDAPRLLLRAADHILTANELTASTTETIYSQMIPLTRERTSEIRLSGRKESLSAQMANTITITDYRDQPETTKQVYDFIGGICSVTINDGTPSVESGITAGSMRTSIEDSLLSALFATRYLAEATLTEEASVYRLDFVGNDAYCNDLTRDLSSFFNLSLDGTAHRDTAASGYLCIDRISGLPVAMGMYFTRTHISGDIPYVMSYRLDQTIALNPAS